MGVEVCKLLLCIGKLLEFLGINHTETFLSACADVKKCLYYAATYIYTYRDTLVALNGVPDAVGVLFPGHGTCQAVS